MKLFPYLYFNGECEAAFKLYERILGAKIETLMRYAGSPAAEQAPEGAGHQILHGSLKVGETVVLASDAPPGHYHAPQGFSLTLRAETATEAERLFAALAEGGKVAMPMATTFFASRFGMLTDRYGVPWMVLCDAAR